MSEENKLKCSVCGAYLFEEDDVVHCPECGAPHHRECYNKLGKCGFFDKHGTSEEYKPEPIVRESQQNTAPHVKCGMCGNSYDASEKRCPECNAPNMLNNRFGFTFDFLGGVDPNLDVGKGVTADEAKQFVLVNTQRYIPKFAMMKVGKKTSWNWLAFLFPCGWFLSRKMYKAGAFIGALSVAFSLLVFPFANVIYSLNPDFNAGYAEFGRFISENIGVIGIPALVCAAAALVLNIALRVVSGIFGDVWYRNYCVETVSHLKTDSDDFGEDMRRKGGVNFFLFVVGTLAVEYLPTLIEMIFGL